MIKTDYKPISTDKDIFSSTRKRSAAPVVFIAIIALLLAIWGLWAAVTEDSVVTKIKEPAVSDKNIDLKGSNQTTQRQDLKLDFQYDNKDSQKKHSGRDTPAVKKSDVKKKEKPPELTSHSQDSSLIWNKARIRPGDSMARVFQRLGFTPGELHGIISLGKKTAVLKKIKPGNELEYSKGSSGRLSAIRYSIDQLNTLVVTKSGDDWLADVETKELEIRTTNARGIINSSLFLAGKKAGLTDALVMELAGIFGWDIDFILDIREGDNFTLIYEEKFVRGDKIGNGNILAAEFVNQGRPYRAVRYTDSSGSAEYYTPKGMSMRKAFLRAPLDFSYISSNFKPRRFHPILKRVKAHNGVDYRAPKGTPVKAAGDGKVITSAYSKYNGHHVFIQHGQKYVTKYLHFTKRKVRRGNRVKQGQIIGYVGATGLAQAPHLHYEFLVNGVHRNPRTIKLPDAKPINQKERSHFTQKTRDLVKQLDVQKHLYTESPDTAE